MVIRSVDFLEGVTPVPSNVRPNSIQQAGIAVIHYSHWHAVDVMREADVVCSTFARRCSIAIQVHARRRLVPIDRKSTRLNSSHLGISYAVFCLKKKKRHATD